jgi:sugar phosphate isomerase/epimerase
MQASWESMLTLGIVHCMIYPECITGTGPIVETMTELAVDDFFTGAEVTWIKDPAVREAVKDIADQSRLKLGYAGQPTLLLQGLSLNDADDDGRAEAVAQIKACVDEAKELGCGRVGVLSGPLPEGVELDRALDWLAGSIKHLCQYGQEQGLGITLETFDHEIDKKSVLGPSKLAADFAARIKADYPDFGLLYDLSHMPMLGESAAEALTTLKDHLVHIHLGNCVITPGETAYGDQHPRLGFPGGENDVPEMRTFLEALFEIGYLRPEAGVEKPWVSFEVKPVTGESSALVIANTKRAWRQVWAEMADPA